MSFKYINTSIYLDGLKIETLLKLMKLKCTFHFELEVIIFCVHK